MRGICCNRSLRRGARLAGHKSRQKQLLQQTDFPVSGHFICCNNSPSARLRYCATDGSVFSGAAARNIIATDRFSSPFCCNKRRGFLLYDG